MSYTEELLQDTALTEAVIRRDLEALSRCCEEMDIPSRVLPAAAQAPLPSLVAMLDSGEEDKPWVITHSFVPLDRETAKQTKYLQFYCELPGSVEEIDPLALLDGVNRLNQILPLGSVVLVEPRPQLGLPRMAALRAVQGFPLDRLPDQEIFREDMGILETGCQITAFVMDALRAGQTAEEALAQLRQ